MQLENFNVVSYFLHKYINNFSLLWQSPKYPNVCAEVQLVLPATSIIKPLIYWQHRNNMEHWQMGKSPHKPWDIIKPWRFLLNWFLKTTVSYTNVCIWTKYISCTNCYIRSLQFLVLYPLTCCWILESYITTSTKDLNPLRCSSSF